LYSGDVKINLITKLRALLYGSGSQPGVSLPLGEHEKLTGGTPNFKNHTKLVFFVEFLIWGVHRGDTIMIWRYAEG
jgi:hypothetical protein